MRTIPVIRFSTVWIAVVAGFVLASICQAQTAPDQTAPTADASTWPELAVHAKPPGGLSLTLSLPRDHFYQGEIIPATLTFANTSSKGYHMWGGKYDRSGRLPDVKFAGRDADGHVVEDSLGWIYGLSMVGAGGGMGSDQKLGSWGLPVTVNGWLRFDHPGRYRIAAWSSRITPAEYPATSGNFLHRGIEMVSNIVEITIDPLPPDKAQAVLDDARQKIDAVAGVDPNASHPYPEGKRIEDAQHAAAAAVTTLRFLQTSGARAELRQVLAQPDYWNSWNAAMGLYSAPDPGAEARLLLGDVKAGRLKATDQVINTYTQLVAYPQRIAAWRAHLTGNDVMKVIEDSGKIGNAARQEILAAARAAADKSGTTNLELVWSAFLTDQNDPAARADVIAHQLEFSDKQKESLLYFIQNDVSEREREKMYPNVPFSAPNDAEKFLPLLREQVSPPHAQPNAFAILARLRPDEARPLLIKAVAGPDHPFFDQSGGFAVNGSALPLLSFPAGPIPELQGPLRDLLREDRYAADAVLLIDRYGAPGLLPSVIGWYLHASNESVWVQAAALRFWIRNDPPAGLKQLAAAVRQHDANNNYRYILQETLSPQWTPAALPLVLQSLQDPTYEVQRSALTVAILHGDASCAVPTLAAVEKMSSRAKPQAARDLLNTKNWTWSQEQQQQLRQDADALSR